MSETAPERETGAAPASVSETPPAETPAARGAGATRAVGLGVFLLLLALIAINLVGNRLTPATDQARIRTYVVPVAPEVSGTISRVYVRNNQLVRQGEALFTVGGDSFEIAAEKARADISATRREQEAQDAQIIAAIAQQRIAEAELEKAAKDATRLERIFAEDRGAISVRRLEIARATLSEAGSRVVAAKAQVAQARAARGLLDANNDRLIAAESALKKAELDLRRTTVFAPGLGLITDLSTEVGQFAGAGNAVMTFISTTDVWITADMTENNVGLMERGAPAEIVLDALPGTVLKGRVRSIGYGVKAGGRNSPGALPTVQNSRDFLRPAQRFPVIIEFADMRSVPLRKLREGGQADVIVYTGDNPVMNALGRLYIRAMAYLSYAY